MDSPSSTAHLSATPSALYAGFWKRFVAAAIDYVLVLPIGLFIVFSVTKLFLAAGLRGNRTEGLSVVVALLLVHCLLWLYFALLESSTWQGTVGKKALGVLVTDLAGARIGFGRATGRYFAKFLSHVILWIGYLMAAFTEKKQGLHDIIADTLVVNKA